MLISSILTSTTLISMALAAHVVVEKRTAPPANWKRSTIPVDSRSLIPLRIGLRQNNLHRVASELDEVSNPSSPNFGKHWTPKQVAEFFAPSASAITAIQGWLVESGLDASRHKLSGGSQWMTLDVTVAEAEELLQSRYEAYQHDEGEIRMASTSYSVPDHIRHYIDFITPTLHFDLPVDGQSIRKRAAEAAAPKVGSKDSGNGPKFGPGGFQAPYQAAAAAGNLTKCDSITTLACLEQLYNYAGYNQTAIDKNTLGIVEYTPNSYSPQDLDMFFAQYQPGAVGTRPKTYIIDYGVITPVPTNFEVNGESDLDLEYAMGIVYPLIPELYQVGALGSFNNFLDALDASYCTYEGGDDHTQDGVYSLTPGACGGAPFSAVISTSYASNEADLTPAYMERQCNEYAKLGLLGTTFLYSSGDYGVAGNFGLCIDKTTGAGTVPAEQGVTGVTFNPSFPGTCPYITSVGGTQVKAGHNVSEPDAEEACQTVIYSGGGFSNVFAMPEYQKTAVASYFKDNLPTYTAVQYNNSQQTRGYPDIALNAANYAVSYAGANGVVYGTSASSPVGAAIFALINDARYAVGKGPIGFINTAIYTEAFRDAFNDITEGGNQGCGTPGFTAVPGWDSVTGLGTPNFQKLRELWLNLP